MNAFQLLFNPNGRITRLSYALLNGVFGALNFGLVALIVWRGGGDFWTAVSLGPMAMIERSPALGFVICVGLFVQACLAIKRSRDMMGSPLVGFIYVFAWAAPYVLFNSRPSLSSISVAEYALTLPALVLGLVLLFKGSQEIDTVEGALGNQAPDIEPQDIAYGVGKIDGETDLVARAAMLRKADELKVAQRVQAQTTKAHSTAAGTAGKPKGFGRRNLATTRIQ